MIGFKGYVASRPFQRQRAPQHVQNLVIRDYCQARGMGYLLSSTEYAIPGSFLMLRQLLENLESLEGIVFYSIFQMPEGAAERSAIYDQVISMGKSLHFAVEALSLSRDSDRQRLEDIWNVHQAMSSALDPQELV